MMRPTRLAHVFSTALRAACTAMLLHFSFRKSPPRVARAVTRLDYRTQTRLMGIRPTKALRDRLRARWLRIARPSGLESPSE